jgi:hypothetical protein
MINKLYKGKNSKYNLFSIFYSRIISCYIYYLSFIEFSKTQLKLSILSLEVQEKSSLTHFLGSLNHKVQ